MEGGGATALDACGGLNCKSDEGLGVGGMTMLLDVAAAAGGFDAGLGRGGEAGARPGEDDATATIAPVFFNGTAGLFGL